MGDHNRRFHAASVSAAQNRPYVLETDAAATLSPQHTETLVRSTGAFTLTLPKAADAFPTPYCIKLVEDGGNVTVAFPTDTVDPSNLVMTAAGDYVVALPTPFGWVVLAEVTT